MTLREALSDRLSPERTRKPTWIERQTVCRLSWDGLVRLNRYLDLLGWLTTGLWIAFMLTVLFGVDWKSVVENAANNGKPVRGALVLAIILSVLLFVAAHSVVGYARWRVQRELWRREVSSTAK